MEEDNDGDGPSRKHRETIVNYLTMTIDISLKLDEILDKMERFIGKESYYELYYMQVKTRMKDIFKVLQEKEPENCLQILVDVLVECGCLKNTGWKEKPDPISALLLELREPISVIERLMTEGDVDKVKQLLSQYPIPQHMEHIIRECCLLSLERRDLNLVKFLYQEYRRMLDNIEILEHFLTKAVDVDFTEGVQFLLSQGLPPEENINCYKLLEKVKSVDMLKLLLSEENIRQSLNDVTRFTESILYHQILNSSTQADCMSRVQILVDAGASVESLIDFIKRKAWLKIIKERWFQVFDYLLNQLKDINFTYRDKQNIHHVILVRDEDGDVRNNILDFVRNLVERGIDIHCVDFIGQSPLMLSCRAGYCDVVMYLIERGAGVNKVDEHGQTALMLAFRSGNKDIAEYLIQHCGADVDKVDNDGETALMLACKGGNKDIVEYLIQHGGADVREVGRGADVNKVNNKGQTALMWACEGGNKDVVKYLIQHCRADVDIADKYGQTALTWTCERGHTDIVEYLIQYDGAEVNKVDNDGQTALMFACERGHTDIVEHLIEHGGADVNKVNHDGQTVLMWACEGGHKDTVEYLIQHCGADVNKADDKGRTALMWASEEGKKDVVEYLIQHGGADVDKANNRGRTALMLACKIGHKDVVECLIQDGGADVNMGDYDAGVDEDNDDDMVEEGRIIFLGKGERTALMWACKKGHKDIVEYLIQHCGAEVNEVDNDGTTALMFACKKGYKDVVEYLIKHGGADVDTVNIYQDTALKWACRGVNRDIVKCLIQHGGADVNMMDLCGESVLYHCPDEALFKFLVESGADLSLPFNGVRLFEDILKRKSHESFLFLISLKPQIVDVTDKGENILHVLAQVNYEFTMCHFDWLFDGHVDINYENRHTDTPLMVAAVLLNEKYLEVFTHHPAVDLNKQNNNGHTALHCLILGFTELIQGFRQRHNEGIAQNYCKQFYPMYMRCVDSLLGAGTDVNVQDNEGRTVLMMAVRENDKQLVRKLLDAGAMVDKVDRSGRHALHYVGFSDSVYDLTIFFLIFPSGENHLLDLPCIHGNTLIQTVLQFPTWWEPCKVVAFVRWLVSRNCSLRHLRGRTGHSTYNQLSLDDFSCSQRQNLRELLYRSGAQKEESISSVNFQAEDEVENAINHSRNREMFEQFCLNVSLEAKCIIVLRQVLGTEIRAKLPGLEIPHLNNFLLLEDVVGDGDDGRVLGGFDELEDESDSCSYIVDKDREYFHYLEDGTNSIHRYFLEYLEDETFDRIRAYSYYKL